MKFFLFFDSSGHLVYRSRPDFSILLEGNLSNIPVKFQQEEIAFKANYSRVSIFSSGSHFVHQSETILAILVDGHLSNNPMKFE